MANQTCATCRWWRASPHHDGGECRRYPPTYDQELVGHAGYWPVTAAGDWCGEWRAKAEHYPGHPYPNPDCQCPGCLSARQPTTPNWKAKTDA